MAELVLKGDVQLKRRLAALARRSPQAAGRALYEEAETIMKTSKAEYVPVDTGTLRSTGIVQPAKVTASGAEVVMGYGGPAGKGGTPAPTGARAQPRIRQFQEGEGYAVYIHENPRAGRTGGLSPQGKRYKSFATHGQWKYLETPFNAAVRGMAARLARRLRSEIR